MSPTTDIIKTYIYIFIDEAVNFLDNNVKPKIQNSRIIQLNDEKPNSSKAVLNRNEYMPGMFTYSQAREVLNLKNKNIFFNDLIIHVEKITNKISNLLLKKNSQGIINLDESQIRFIKYYFIPYFQKLISEGYVDMLTHPQVEELIYEFASFFDSNLFDTIKFNSNELAKKNYPIMKQSLQQIDSDQQSDLLSKSLLFASIGNGLEEKHMKSEYLDMSNTSDRTIEINNFFHNLETKLQTIPKGSTINYFLDNAGEVIYDLLPIEFLIRRGFKVSMLTKESLSADDMTYNDTVDLIEKLKSQKGYEWLNEYVESGKLEILSNNSKTPSADFNKIPDNIFQDVAFSIMKGGGNHYGSLPAKLNHDVFHVYLIKEDIQEAITAHLNPTSKKINKGSLVFHYRQKGDESLTLDNLVEDGKYFNKSGKRMDQKVLKINDYSSESLKTFGKHLAAKAEDIYNKILSKGDLGEAAKDDLDKSFVTAADYLVQMYTRIELARNFPEDEFVGEEFISDNEIKSILEFINKHNLEKEYSELVNLYVSYNYKFKSEEEIRTATTPPKRLWILDPLDGTKHFRKRNNQYAFSLALYEKDKLTTDYKGRYGIMYAPNHKMKFKDNVIEGPLLEGFSGELPKLFTRVGSDSLNHEEILSHHDKISSANLNKWKFIVKDHTEGSPYADYFQQNVPPLSVDRKWAGPAVIGLMEVILGNYSVYSGRMQLWDFAAGCFINSLLEGETVLVENEEIISGERMNWSFIQSVLLKAKRPEHHVILTRGTPHSNISNKAIIQANEMKNDLNHPSNRKRQEVSNSV